MQLFVSSEILTPPLPLLVSQGNSLSSILQLSSTQGNNSVTRNGDQILFFWRNLKKRSHPCSSLDLQLLLTVILTAQKKLLRPKAAPSVSLLSWHLLKEEVSLGESIMAWDTLEWTVKKEKWRKRLKWELRQQKAKSLGIKREKCSSCLDEQTRNESLRKETDERWERVEEEEKKIQQIYLTINKIEILQPNTLSVAGCSGSLARGGKRDWRTWMGARPQEVHGQVGLGGTVSALYDSSHGFTGF